jgi:hypothetical protein
MLKMSMGVSQEALSFPTSFAISARGCMRKLKARPKSSEREAGAREDVFSTIGYSGVGVIIPPLHV